MARKSVMTYLEIRALIQEVIEGLEMYLSLYERREDVLNLKTRKEIEDVGRIIERNIVKVEMKIVSAIKVLDDIRIDLCKYWDKPDVLAKYKKEPEYISMRKDLNKKVKRLMNDLKHIDV